MKSNFLLEEHEEQSSSGPRKPQERKFLMALRNPRFLMQEVFSRSGERNPVHKRRKGQEEIVGFILIVLLVSIIALVFLVIMARKPVERLPSNELESFLQASMKYSTGCYVSAEREYNFKDAIVSCGEINERCLDGKSACEVLNESADFLLRSGWNVCADCPAKAYRFSVKDGVNRTLLNLRAGNCTGDRVYSQVFLPAYSGKITSELEICN